MFFFYNLADLLSYKFWYTIVRQCPDMIIAVDRCVKQHFKQRNKGLGDLRPDFGLVCW